MTIPAPRPLILLLFALLSGCTNVPAELSVRGNSPLASPANYPAMELSQPAAAQPETLTHLDSSGFRILSWNIYKGIKKEWRQDLQRFAEQCDLLILQEGYLNQKMHQFLTDNLYYWHIAEAFTFRTTICGVLTAAKVTPLSQCAMRQQEPLLRLPKTTMVTSYGLSGSQETLLVINLHMVNFTLGQKAFRAQLEAVASLMDQHQGPMLLAGDLNTWNSKRLASVHAFTNRYGLQEVVYPSDQRSTRFGKVLDHIWYRGLIPSAAHIKEVTSSDHNPCLVTFKVG